MFDANFIIENKFFTPVKQDSLGNDTVQQFFLP